MRILAMLALVALMACTGTVEPVPVHSGGRVVREGNALRAGWPGVYFEGRFTGTAVEVGAETRNEHVRVLVDGVEKARVTDPFSGRMVIDGLTPGAHVVRLEKLTESQQGEMRFTGFYPVDGKALAAPKPRERSIEFIGDSHSVGYGNLSPTRACSGAQVHDTTDTQQAFGPILAKRLDADYRVIAYSGYGVVRNYAGNMPGESLPSIYRRALPGEAGAAADDGWRPQLFVIYLGTNDFSTPVKPGEAWADDAALRAAWRERYVGFVRELSVKQPRARFVLVGSAKFLVDLRQVAEALGGKPVVVAEPVMEMTGCNGHPSLKDHRALADAVGAASAAMPGVWR